MKKHLLTIRTGDGKVHTFLVPGTTGSDGKTRISWSAYNKACKQANVQRGHATQIG